MIEYNNLRLAKDGIQFPASYKTLEKLYQSKKALLEQLKMKSVSRINQRGIMVGGAVEDTPENRDLFLLEMVHSLLEMVHSLSSTVDTLWAFLREIEKKVDKEYNDTNERITMNYKEMNQKMETMSKKMEYLPPNTKYQL